jgi:hypothetical protein
MDLSAKIEGALQEALETGLSHGNTPSSALKAALDENQDLIRKAVAQGYTATCLAKKLKAAGISASVETLQRYVKHVTKTKATATARKPKASTSRAKDASADSHNKAYEAEDRTA